MQNLIENTILSAVLAVTGTVAPMVLDNHGINPLIMDVFQLCSYTGAILVAIVTLFRYYKEIKKSRNERDTENLQR